jgi:hypothetical protein
MTIHLKFNDDGFLAEAIQPSPLTIKTNLLKLKANLKIKQVYLRSLEIQIRILQPEMFNFDRNNKALSKMEQLYLSKLIKRFENLFFDKSETLQSIEQLKMDITNYEDYLSGY